MNVRAGGRLTQRNTSVAAASAKKTSALAPARERRRCRKRRIRRLDITAASPSLPSMKLKRFADHTIANVMPIDTRTCAREIPSARARRQCNERKRRGERLHHESNDRAALRASRRQTKRRSHESPTARATRRCLRTVRPKAARPAGIPPRWRCRPPAQPADRAATDRRDSRAAASGEGARQQTASTVAVTRPRGIGATQGE